MGKKKTAIIVSVVVLICIAVGLYFVFGNKKYEITFSTDGGTTVETMNVLKSKTITRPADPTKEGYTFDNWYVNGEVFDFSKPITEDMTLTAKWIKNSTGTDIKDNEDETDTTKMYTVTFDSNGGSAVTSLNVKENETVTQPTNPTRSGYKFVSWLLNDKKYDFGTKITGNITLKANWSKVTTTSNKTVAVTGVSISKTSLNLKVGEKNTLSATVSPSNATNKATTWKSSNTSVATVDASGNVTAVGAGSTTITVTAGSKTSTCTVTVTNNITYSIEWVKVPESSIGQYKMYIKSSEGKYVAGKAEITTAAGKVTTVDVDASGVMYIKSAVTNATVKSVN